MKGRARRAPCCGAAAYRQASLMISVRRKAMVCIVGMCTLNCLRRMIAPAMRPYFQSNPLSRRSEEKLGARTNIGVENERCKHSWSRRAGVERHTVDAVAVRHHLHGHDRQPAIRLDAVRQSAQGSARHMGL